MRLRSAVPMMIALAVSLSACTTTTAQAPRSDTPIELVVSAEYNPENLGGAVSWTITGGSGRIPDDSSVFVSIAHTGADVLTPSTESSVVTDDFLERVGENQQSAQVIVNSGTSSGECAFTLSPAGAAENDQESGEMPRVHIALIESASGDVVAVRSAPVAIVDLGVPGT